MLIVNLVLKKIHIKLKIIPEVTGTDRILRSKAMRRTNNFELTQDQEGTTNSGGHLFYVTFGGIVRFWSPLYLSGSISQNVIPTIK